MIPKERIPIMKSLGLRIGAALVFCCGLVLSTGCVKKSEYDALMAEYNAAIGKQDKLTKVVTEQDAELSALKSDYNKLAEIFAEEIENQELELELLVDGIDVAIPSDVMYASGSATATVGSDGLEFAKRLAKFLADTDYFVSVVGHTDSQQPSPALAKKYPTNWELAAARAANATRYLVSQGVDPTSVVASSRGEFAPVASNDTAEGRAQNRRIQIILRDLP
jgi:chemotaxis protein MotB